MAVLMPVRASLSWPSTVTVSKTLVAAGALLVWAQAEAEGLDDVFRAITQPKAA